MIRTFERAVLALALTGALAAAQAAYAAGPKQASIKEAAQEKPTLPPSGLISGTKTGGYGATQIDGPWGGINTGGTKKDPVSGSCSKSGSFSWKLQVFNNSKDRYNVSLEMLQYDIRNQQLKSDGFFAAIPGGQKIERIYPAHPDSAQCAVKLNNWKMIPHKKSSEELEQEIDRKKGELSELEGELSGGVPPAPGGAK